jgi:hypothetical protein
MMRITLAAFGTVLAVSAFAADQPPAPVQGQDAMSDRGRTGPDGWSWAPVTRDQAPTGPSPAASANRGGAPNTQPGPMEGRQLPPGEDPGTPSTPQSQGPGAAHTGR